MIQKKGFLRFSYISLAIISVIVLLPFVLMIASSFTSEEALHQYGYGFWPKEVSFSAYKYLLEDGVTIFRAYGITALVTIVGTVASVVMTTMLAYGLSIEKLPGKKIISFFVLFAMLFSGGIVPSYIMWTNVFHIKNTIWALIVPNYLVFGFYVIMMRTYFQQNIPTEVLESARIDGASEFVIMIKLAIPMAVPIVATVGMMVAITYWNDWNNGLYYVTDSKLYSIQLILNKMIQSADAIKSITNVKMELPSTSVKMAIAVMGALPLMCVFPFFQKYYTKGITVGAVKG